MGSGSIRPILDCSWAKLGCERPDLNEDGVVDAAGRAEMHAAGDTAGACDDDDDWCDGADLDRSGAFDALDVGFMDAAQGCHDDR